MVSGVVWRPVRPIGVHGRDGCDTSQSPDALPLRDIPINGQGLQLGHQEGAVLGRLGPPALADGPLDVAEARSDPIAPVQPVEWCACQE